MVPGVQLCTKTSERSARRRTASRPSGWRRLRAMLFLPRLWVRKKAERPSGWSSTPRPGSPWRDSILITSAPKSASSAVAAGPICPMLRSTTRTPSKAATVLRLEACKKVLAGGVAPAVAVDDHTLHPFQCEQRGLCDAGSDGDGLVHHPVGGDDGADQADAERLLRVNAAACQAEVARQSAAYDLGQRAVERGCPELDLRVSEGCVLSGDPHVAEGCEVQAAAHGRTVNSRHQRLR